LTLRGFGTLFVGVVEPFSSGWIESLQPLPTLHRLQSCARFNAVALELFGPRRLLRRLGLRFLAFERAQPEFRALRFDRLRRAAGVAAGLAALRYLPLLHGAGRTVARVFLRARCIRALEYLRGREGRDSGQHASQESFPHSHIHLPHSR